MRGRRPKPTALHRLQGTFHTGKHGRGRAREPLPEGELDPLAPPPWFTAAQREVWQYALDHAPKGVLKRIDLGMLVAWVEAFDRHREAMEMQAQLDRSASLKLLIRTPTGLIASPYNDILDKTAKKMFRAAQELGFSPAARPRLHVAEPEPKDDADNPWAALRLIPGGRA
jgi:P27 family predicted phage terminase small subunit